MSDTLVLDKAYRPVETRVWQDAVKLVYEGVADLLVEDDKKTLHSDSFEMGMPRVIRIRNWVKKNLTMSSVPLSRRNLILRDSIIIDGKPVAICQYCGIRITAENYSADHVMPRSLGGQSTWENLVVCCQDCNAKKANKTLKQAEMKLLKRPVEPNPEDPRFTFKLRIHNPHPSWEGYLYWNVELEK